MSQVFSSCYRRSKFFQCLKVYNESCVISHLVVSLVSNVDLSTRLSNGPKKHEPESAFLSLACYASRL
ncbi:unnamed protein product, partial [Cyprideis torosa]